MEIHAWANEMEPEMDLRGIRFDLGTEVSMVVEGTEDEWMALLATGPGRMMMGNADCTPGYYNNEGQDRGPAAKSYVGYPAGPVAYFRYLDNWRNAGTLDGLEFR